MAAFGTFTLLLALVLATYGGVASVVGARRGITRLVESGRGAAYALAAVLALTSVTILYAFVTGDYSIKYIQRYSDASSPLFYKITAYWGGLDGSILWWVFLLSVFGAIAIYINRNRNKEIMPYVVATLMSIASFFLFLIVFHKNPFDQFLSEAPTQGQGLNPILQNAYMITHPPSLYIGLVGMSIPYAFAMGALISGHLDDAWIVAVRRWTLLAWFFLSMGLTLGMLWAYEELGWGGFWAWDPVENAGFVPWLTATAFFHSVTIQERRGMLKIWNFTLVILTFLLTIVATFLTRSGVVMSVHSFGEDNKLAMIFAVFMALIVVVSFGFVIKRLPELRSRAKLEHVVSREGAFLLNNWILLFAAFFVLFGTLFPKLKETFFGVKDTVGPPFFNRWMVPIGLILLFLTGVGPLIAWRKATIGHLRYQFTWPSVACLLTAGVCVAFGLHQPSFTPVIAFSFCAFTFTTIAQEFTRGASIRKRNTGSDAVTAVLGMVIRGRRRYGGYVVHVGIVLMFLGFAGQAYQKEEDTKFVPGQVMPFGKYNVRFDKLVHSEDRQKEMVTASFTILRDGKEIAKMDPGKWHFTKTPQPTTEVAINRSPAEDLYITLGSWDFADDSVAVRLVINPLINWIWFGFILLAIGTGIAMLPETVLAPLAARAGVTAAADTAARVTGLILLGASLLLSAGVANAAAPDKAAITAERKWLRSNLMCMCGCRASLGDCAMENCHHKDPDNKLIADLLGQGKSRDDILKIFVEKHGSQVLLTPPDTGLNRLAWAVPYAMGVMGAGVLALGAWRFSRASNKSAAPDPDAPRGPKGKTPVDADADERLEDELAKID